jgi:hypothetical protein
VNKVDIAIKKLESMANSFQDELKKTKQNQKQIGVAILKK